MESRSVDFLFVIFVIEASAAANYFNFFFLYSSLIL